MGAMGNVIVFKSRPPDNESWLSLCNEKNSILFTVSYSVLRAASMSMILMIGIISLETMPEGSANIVPVL